MRTALVCLLSLVLSCVAWAAPAPLPKDRDRTPSPSVEVIRQHLLEVYEITVESVEARGNRQWLVVGYVPHYTRRARHRLVEKTVHLVKYQGKDHQNRPQFELVEVMRAHND